MSVGVAARSATEYECPTELRADSPICTTMPMRRGSEEVCDYPIRLDVADSAAGDDSVE